MEKNTTFSTSNFSICKKLRQAFATNPTFKAIRRMKQFHNYQEPNSENFKVLNTENGGTKIPIVFDHSTPIASNSMVHGHASKVASPHVGISERKGKVVTKVEPKVETRIPNLKEHHSVVGLVNLEQQQGKKTLDINDTFVEYIERAKNRIKTVSNVGRGQNNHSVPVEVSKMENQKDQFSEFIQQAKKKIRTTSSHIGKTGSLERA